MARRKKGHRAPALIFPFAALIIVVFSEEYVTEFDNDLFWTKVVDGLPVNGIWERTEWKQGDSIPEPEGDRWLLEMVVVYGSVWLASVRSPDLNFTDGAFINITFWITSKYPGSSTLRIYKTVDDKNEEPAFLDLTSYSQPDNRKWTEVQEFIPLGSKTSDTFKLTIYGLKSYDPESVIMIDRVVVNTDGEPPDAATSSTTELAATTVEASETPGSTSTFPHPLITTSQAPFSLISTITSQQPVTTSSAAEQSTTRHSESPATVLGTTANIITITEDSRTATDAARTTSMNTHTSTHLSSMLSITEDDEMVTTMDSSFIGTVEEIVADGESQTAQAITGVLGALGLLLIILFILVFAMKKSKKQEDKKILIITEPIIEKTVLPESIADQEISDILQKTGSVLILSEEINNQ